MKTPLKLWMLPQPWKALAYLVFFPFKMCRLTVRACVFVALRTAYEIFVELPRSLWYGWVSETSLIRQQVALDWEGFREEIFARSPRDATDEPP